MYGKNSHPITPPNCTIGIRRVNACCRSFSYLTTLTGNGTYLAN